MPAWGIAAIALTASSAFAPSNSARIDSTERPEVVGEDAEPAAVGHADHDLLGAAAVARVTSSSIIGTTASRPSIENIFWPR